MIASLGLLIMLVLPFNAFAYIDPGTGSYIIQVVLAVFFSAIVAIRVFWNKIKGFFKARFARNNPDRTSPEQTSKE